MPYHEFMFPPLMHFERLSGRAMFSTYKTHDSGMFQVSRLNMIGDIASLCRAVAAVGTLERIGVHSDDLAMDSLVQLMES